MSVHSEGQRRLVGGVIHTVDRAGDKGRLSAKHVEGRFGESVVNIAVIGDVNSEIGGVVAKFKVKPDATHIAGPLIGRDGVEAKDGVVKDGHHAVFNRHAGGLSCGCDFNRGRFRTIVLNHRRHRRDGFAELAAFKRCGVGIPLGFWDVDHRLAAAHRLPDTAVDLRRSKSGEIEAGSNTSANAESV